MSIYIFIFVIWQMVSAYKATKNKLPWFFWKKTGKFSGIIFLLSFILNYPMLEATNVRNPASAAIASALGHTIGLLAFYIPCVALSLWLGKSKNDN